MKHSLPGQVRDAGYETLFLLGGFLALSVHPTRRNLERIFQWIDESQSRREHLRRLERRGLIEAPSSNADEGQGEWVARLTDHGRAVFSGGRHPELAWDRPWDGQWRLLSFDLPRRENEVRMKLRRWLDANYFGRLQGSVFISPDPVPSLEEFVAADGVEAVNFMVFEGTLAGKQEPGEVAETAWDFATLNAAYRGYLGFANHSLESLKRKTPTMAQLKKILREDRKQWWAAVRCDPLLPKMIHPKGYQGIGAWRARCKLLSRLGKNIGAVVGST